jgi:hypothetical protein
MHVLIEKVEIRRAFRYDASELSKTPVKVSALEKSTNSARADARRALARRPTARYLSSFGTFYPETER